MSWYYAEGGKQQGPVSDTEFDALIRAGTIRPEMLVWREGMPGWKPLREVMPEAAATAPPPFIPTPGMLQCGECGKEFAPDEVVRINDRWICASCKPIHLQRLMEGSAPSGATSAGTVPLEEVREREYEHDIGDYLSRGWEFFKADAGNLIGVTFIIYMCIGAGQFLPYLGGLIALVITGPLMAGLWLYYLSKMRGGTPKVSEAFKGFGPRFGQLMWAHVVPSVLAGLCFIPAGLVLGVGIALTAASRQGGGSSDLMIPVLIGGGLVGLIGLCGMLYLSTCWLFTIQLVADKGMRFWPAMALSRAVVTKHWWQNFLLMFVAGLIGSVGLLLCLVGVLITGPVAISMTAMAYEKLFGDMAATEG